MVCIHITTNDGRVSLLMQAATQGRYSRTSMLMRRVSSSSSSPKAAVMPGMLAFTAKGLMYYFIIIAILGKQQRADTVRLEDKKWQSIELPT